MIDLFEIAVAIHCMCRNKINYLESALVLLDALLSNSCCHRRSERTEVRCREGRRLGSANASSEQQLDDLSLRVTANTPLLSQCPEFRQCLGLQNALVGGDGSRGRSRCEGRIGRLGTEGRRATAGKGNVDKAG